MRSRLTSAGLLVVGATIAIACSKGVNMEAAPRVQHVHPIGLRVTVPAGVAPQERATGYLLTAGEETRVPLTVELAVVAADPVLQGGRERTLEDGAIARFEVSKQGGGSGGAEYRLRASKPAASRWIAMTAIVQAEHSEPTFDEAWTILDTAKLENKPSP